jgi:RimJ/RimL family protein N-acetyltransferase
VITAGSSALNLREVRASDEKLLYNWRNDPSLVPRSSGQRPVACDEHTRWFKSSLCNPSRRLQIIEVGEQPAGALRFDRAGPKLAVISVYLIEGFTGRGYGPQAIRRASQAVATEWAVCVAACVRIDNFSAAKAFLKSGFVESEVGTLCPQGHRAFVFRAAEAANE